ncbi:MAG: hypothetical protein M1508_05045 [Nitrospirae bacterium]|nr:hypothetical protein [Nitrospirota bacterium]MCL5423397.1 hypothetical protein [Nitrospirota bacterium]
MPLPSSPDKKRFANPRAEGMRLRALYRDYVLKGKVRLPAEAMKALIGPDCAYHLYRLSPEEKQKS